MFLDRLLEKPGCILTNCRRIGNRRDPAKTMKLAAKSTATL
jgi:hypothetical protein